MKKRDESWESADWWREGVLAVEVAMLSVSEGKRDNGIKHQGACVVQFEGICGVDM